ncbi:MAG: DUF167 domain-containing protein [Holosporaceae bacterium]|nr:DUF167 domain-containing protein [Holosporaceae bacterium]
MQQCKYYKKTSNGIYLKVKVVPRSSQNEVIGIVEDRIKVTVLAVPQKGEANAALENTLAAFFGIKRSFCQVTFGHKSSRKTVFISIDVEDKLKEYFGKAI